MERKATLALSSAVLAVSAFIIALKLIEPASVGIYIGNGGNTTQIGTASGLYTVSDIVEMFVASVAAGVSATFLLISKDTEAPPPLGEVVLNERKAKWVEVSRTLKDDEMKLYQVVLDAGGLMNQGELVEKSGLSKATVSRTLDLLESRGLIEKRRRGMSNVILLK